jgi:uncharacterized membrane protein YagU involved in acid resistance
MKPKLDINYTSHSYWGENMVKGARGTKVKVIFQGMHMTHIIFVLVYNFKFCILSTPFNTTF